MNKLFESVDNFFETDNSVLKESSDYCVAMECDRRGYSPSQVIGDTLTVGELVDYLSGLDQDMKIVTSHDNGYTYGAISTSDFRDEPIDSDEDDEYDESETSKVKERTLKEDLTNDNHNEIKNKFLEVLDEFTGEYDLASEDSKFTPGDDDFNLPEFDLVFDVYHDDNTDNKDNVKAFADKLHSFSKENELDIVAKYLMDDEDMPNILHVNIIPGGDVFVFSIDGDFIYKENYPFDESEKPKVEEGVKSDRAERIKALRESVLNRRNNLNILSESEDPKVNKKISECNFKNYSKMMNKELNSNILNRAGEKPVEDKSL